MIECNYSLLELLRQRYGSDASYTMSRGHDSATFTVTRGHGKDLFHYSFTITEEEIARSGRSSVVDTVFGTLDKHFLRVDDPRPLPVHPPTPRMVGRYRWIAHARTPVAK